MYKKRKDLIKKYKEKFPSDDGSMIGNYQIEDLLKRGFLVKNEEGRILLGKDFLEIYVDKHIATDEVYKEYPTYFNKDGADIPLSAMDRNVFANIYEDAIMGALDEHEEIIKDIKFGKANDLLNMGIEKFLKSQYWKHLRRRRLEHTEIEDRQTLRDYEFGE
jgi:hypothetical protein